MGKRKPISGRGIPEHPQPFSAAIRVRNMIFSAGIDSQDAETGSEPETPEGQVLQAFANMRRIVEAGGGAVGDIAKVAVYLNDRKDGDTVNAEWIKMFPDEHGHPMRRTVTTE